MQRHVEMVAEISGFLDPAVNTWSSFMNMMAVYLNPVEIARCNNIFDVFDKLMNTGHINYGEYDIIKKAVKKIDVQVLEIIRRYTSIDGDNDQGASRRFYRRTTSRDSK